MRLWWFGIAGVLFSGVVPPAFAQTVYDAHTEVEFVSNVSTIAAGEPFEAAVRMRMDPGWHVYWKNSGDSGLPVAVRWDLPDGFKMSDTRWPLPQRFEEAGLGTYGYTQSLFLITEIFPPKDFVENTVTLRVHVDWLACEKICVPGKADLLLKLEVAQTAQAGAWAHELTQTRRCWPRPSPWPVRAFQDGQSIVLYVGLPPEEQSRIASLEFFPEQNDIIIHSAPQTLRVGGDGLELRIPRSGFPRPRGGVLSSSLNRISGKDRRTGKTDSLSGLLVARYVADTMGGSGRREGFEVVIDHVVAVPMPKAAPALPVLAGVSLATALVFAFIGGLILNLMPCVLPVLSIKVLSLIEHTMSRRQAFAAGGAFALGVLVSCWVLAGLLVLLKTLGRQIGWGFQFQSPEFIIVMSLVLFLFALNLWGIFEIGSLAPRTTGYINRQHKYLKAFFSGVLAMVLATPCTAPFMGTAIGFAITQSTAVNILVFTFLGLGLALPYVLLSAFPQALKFVPKPGPWMMTFKKILAVFLAATVIWLVWILSFLAQAVTLLALAAGFLLTAVGAGIAGREQVRGRNFLVHGLAVLLIVLAAVVPLSSIRMNETKIVATAPSQEAAIPWLDYSPELMQQLSREGKTVFLDFTAKWCISCQANERLALNNREVADKFRELGIVPVRADWTRFDARITRALAELGKNSIPVYVIYYGEGHRDKKVLPEIITPATVLEALESVGR